MKRTHSASSGAITATTIYNENHFIRLLQYSLIPGTGPGGFTSGDIVFVAIVVGFIVLASALGLSACLNKKLLRKLSEEMKTTDETNPSGYHRRYLPEGTITSREPALIKADDARRLSIATQEGIVFCALKDIVRIEASGSYACLHLAGGQKQIASRTLSALETRLQECPGFLRVHKSHLVQISYIIKYQKGDGGTITLTDGTHLPVSRKAKEELLRRLNADSC